MNPPRGPTPYAGVNAVLGSLLPEIRAILGDQLVGLYLAGSLALGDFDPRSSDIDLVAVTGGALAADRFTALQALHARFAASGSAWRDRVEAVYIPQAALREPGPPGARHPVIERGGALAWEPLEGAWVVQCWTLRAHGVALAGPPPATLVPPVDPDALRRVSAAVALGWWRRAQTDPSWIDWMRHRPDHAFVVLTLCRLLYTLETGAVASKPGAARWAAQGPGRPWAALIAQAPGAQQATGMIAPRDLADTLGLLQYTAERFAPWTPASGDV